MITWEKTKCLWEHEVAVCVQGYNFIQESTGTETCFGREKGRLLKMGYKQTCTGGAETIDTEKRKKMCKSVI